MLCGCDPVVVEKPLPLVVRELPRGMRDQGILLDADDLCNSAYLLLNDRPLAESAKLLWHLRHGESTGNAARAEALAADSKSGGTMHVEAYFNGTDFVDTPLSQHGHQQAEAAAKAAAHRAVLLERLAASDADLRRLEAKVARLGWGEGEGEGDG